jgi:hypothetical protein
MSKAISTLVDDPVTAGKSTAELMSEGAKVGCTGMLNQHLIQPLIRRSNGKASDPNDGDGLAAVAFPMEALAVPQP